MEASAASIAAARNTAIDVLDRLVEDGHQSVIEIARREYDEWERAAGRHHHRKHFDANAIIYHRGRWHAAVRMLAALAGLQVSTEEPDLLEFAHALSSYVPTT